MAQLDKESSISNIGEGILVPLLQNSFKVKFNNTEFTTEGQQILTNQVIKTKLNLKQKQIEVWLEHPLCIKNFVSELVLTLTRGTQLSIVGLSGDGTESPIITCYCNCVDHETTFDYSVSGVVVHKLTFTFTNVK